MKTQIGVLWLLILSLCCTRKFSGSNHKTDALGMINKEQVRRGGTKKTSRFHEWDAVVYAARRQGAALYGLDLDTAHIDKLVVLNEINFQGGSEGIGEIIVNDTSRYLYKTDYSGKMMEKSGGTVMGERSILSHLKAHQFRQLESLAWEKSASMSEAYNTYFGMYEKGSGSIYVKLVPAFMDNE